MRVSTAPESIGVEVPPPSPAEAPLRVADVDAARAGAGALAVLTRLAPRHTGGDNPGYAGRTAVSHLPAAEGQPQPGPEQTGSQQPPASTEGHPDGQADQHMLPTANDEPRRPGIDEVKENIWNEGAEGGDGGVLPQRDASGGRPDKIGQANKDLDPKNNQ